MSAIIVYHICVIYLILFFFVPERFNNLRKAAEPSWPIKYELRTTVFFTSNCIFEILFPISRCFSRLSPSYFQALTKGSSAKVGSHSEVHVRILQHGFCIPKTLQQLDHCERTLLIFGLCRKMKWFLFDSTKCLEKAKN